MQTTSTDIRDRRFAQRDEKREASAPFQARRAQVAAVRAAILDEAGPEVLFQSPTCTNYRARRGAVGGEQAEAQVVRHAAGTVIRFWVFGADFGDTRVRDLVLLPSAGEKGVEVWLEADGDLFPHEGKYAVVGARIMSRVQSGR